MGPGPAGCGAGGKLGAQPRDLAQGTGNIPLMPPQHLLSRGVVQHVAGVYLRAQDGGDGPLSAEQEFTARTVQIGRVHDPVTALDPRYP